MQPVGVKFELKCLSQQYLPFMLPVFGNISPWDPTGPGVTETIEGKEVYVSGLDLFKRFVAKLQPDTLQATLLPVVHGYMRVLAAGRSIDELNENKEILHNKIHGDLQIHLQQYGARLDSLNIAEVREEPRANGESYLHAREQKKLSAAIQQAEIDVAENKKMGAIGVAERDAEVRRFKAEVEAKTVAVENEARQRIAESQSILNVTQAQTEQRARTAVVEADAAVAQRKEELEKHVQEARAVREMASKRADCLSAEQVAAECLRVKTQAERDASIQKAEGDALARERLSAADKVQGQVLADNELAMLSAKAEGDLATLSAKAEGEQKLREAQARGTKQMV
jgi:flotillin